MDARAAEGKLLEGLAEVTPKLAPLVTDGHTVTAVDLVVPDAWMDALGEDAVKAHAQHAVEGVGVEAKAVFLQRWSKRADAGAVLGGPARRYGRTKDELDCDVMVLARPDTSAATEGR